MIDFPELKDNFGRFCIDDNEGKTSILKFMPIPSDAELPTNIVIYVTGDAASYNAATNQLTIIKAGIITINVSTPDGKISSNFQKKVGYELLIGSYNPGGGAFPYIYVPGENVSIEASNDMGGRPFNYHEISPNEFLPHFSRKIYDKTISFIMPAMSGSIKTYYS